VEGSALGIGATFSEALLLFIAVIAHKGSESFALCVTLMRYQLPFWQILGLVAFFALMTPLGIALGTSIEALTKAGQGAMLDVMFKSFAAGTFLYISTLHHIRFHKHTEETQGLLEFGCLMTGLVAMGMIAVWV
jgi:zinc transporter ZupT